MSKNTLAGLGLAVALGFSLTACQDTRVGTSLFRSSPTAFWHFSIAPLAIVLQGLLD